MKISELANGPDLRPLKFAAREVPHAVIEPNYTCNRRCAVCYNRYRDEVKSFEQVTGEVELALAKRNLETISLLGGEPTLHPRLADIVRYVKSRKLVCQVLSNGLVLLQDSRDRLLDQLVGAGLDRLVLHVDSGQGLDAAEVEQMRTVLFDKFEQRGLYFALSITLYQENLADIPAVMRRYAHYRFFDGILATIVRDTDHPGAGANSPWVAPDLKDVCSNIASRLRVQPASYLPSNLDDREVRWLIYFYYLNVRTGTTVPVSPAFNRFMRRAYRFTTGKHLFAVTMRPALFRAWFLLTAAVELVLKPSRIGAFLRLVAKSSWLRQLRFHYIVLQCAPQISGETGCVEICYHCPDATIRDGRLAPVCLADRMRPPGRHAAEAAGDSALADEVYAHLEEAA